jgi:DNA-3-methyladenine glycosylase
VADPPARARAFDRDALARPAHLAAPGLVGAVIVGGSGPRAIAIQLTEVEAYEAVADPGSHAHRGRTARNRTMFGPPGHLYVYRHLGLHLCLNVVCHPPGEAGAILLRAGRVIAGWDVARERRLARRATTPDDVALARGPANLAACLGVSLRDDGLDLCADGGVPGVAEPGRQWEQERVAANAAGAGTQSRVGADQSDLRLLPGQAATHGLTQPWAGKTTVAVPGQPPPHGLTQGPRVGVSGSGGDGAVFPWRWWLTGEATVSPYRAAIRRTASRD